MVNFFLFFYVLIFLPKILFRKKIFLFERVLGHPPILHTNGSIIWIHAVSVGEAKAAQPLLQELKVRYPESFFLITTTTITGLEEAKRSLHQADFHRLL